MTQGKLKTLLQPHSLHRAAHHNQLKCRLQRRGQQRASSLSLPPTLEVRTAGRPTEGHAPTRGRDESSPRLCREPGVPDQGSAVFIRSQDFEIPVQTSQSSPGPGPALAGGCAPPQGERSPRILAHSAHSAAAPAAAGLPWGFHHTPAANATLGREGSSERGNMEGGDACLWWFRESPGGPVAKIPHAQCRGPGFNPLVRELDSTATTKDLAHLSEDQKSRVPQLRTGTAK